MSLPKIKWNESVGFLSDIHCETDKADKIFAQHPEIKQWVFCGDLFDFLDPKDNQKTFEWLVKNNTKCAAWVCGNHDFVTMIRGLNIDANQCAALKRFMVIGVKLEGEEFDFLCYHSKPSDFWFFINPGYTELEFVNDFLEIDKYTSFVITGHTHRPMKHTFPYNPTQLISLGAVKNGEYGIIKNNIFEFKKI